MTTITTPPPAPATVSGPARHTRLAEATRGRLAGGVALGEHLWLAGLAYLPLLFARPGVVTDDTKTYLYLDPGRFLSQVVTMWNPTVGLGTVNHQYIGYLLPMGPFFWLFDKLGVPVWVAQRLWLGTILFVAGAGMLYLCRRIGVGGPGRIVAATAFMLTPYFLQYSGRISVILLPWAGLPWMIAFTIMALRRGGWRYPALFALVVALVSSINATAILYVAVAPALWLVYAVLAEKEARWRQALLTALKLGVLAVAVCLWWETGLLVEAAYGVNVLKFTETIPSTSATSTASEVIRGLGYWYFYGEDRLGNWTHSAVMYTQWLWLLAVSYAVPVLAFVSAVAVRWRHRAYFVLLIVVGVTLSVGAHPFDSPTPFGGVFKAFMTDTTAGLALRSTDRATPLVVLGLAVLLGAGVSALWARIPWAGVLAGVVSLGLVIAANPAVFTGDAEVATTFTQPAVLPSSLRQAAAHLNATHPNTRVLEIPGDDFAAQRWGDTIDAPLPALLNADRPFAIHEQQIMGSEATANLLNAIDGPIQGGIEQWQALAPLSRLISAGDVVVQNDTAYERYGIPQPQLVDPQLTPTPAGLSDPVSFGTPVPNVPSYSTLDEADLAAPATTQWEAPLVTYTVNNPRPLVRAESDTGSVVVAGDADGLANMAAAGLLDTTSAIYYAGTLDSHAAQLHQLVASGAQLVLTDTNRKQAYRWDTLIGITGYTENATEQPAKSDLSDNPLDLFPGAPVGAHTLASDVGAATVTASSYGNTVSYTPENRPYAALDGNLDSAWVTGVFDPDPAGEWWQIHLAGPVTTDHITVVQPQTGDVSRSITKASLIFDGGRPVPVTLGPSSRRPGGQVLKFKSRTFSTLRIRIDDTSNDHQPSASASQVGLAEVRIPGVSVAEVIHLPTDLLASASTASATDRLTLVLDRLRVSPYPTRSDPELSMVRQFTLPTARTFTLSGTASLSALLPDDLIQRLLGRPGSTGTGVVAYANGRLPGSLTSGAPATLDGDPTTVWQPGFGAGAQKGSVLHYDLPANVTLDHLDLQVVADGRHSVPTSLSISTETGTRTVTLPPIADSTVPGATTTVPLSFAPLSGRHLALEVTGVRLERATNFFARSPIALPLGIAEVAIPGVSVAPLPADLPGTCRSDLLAIDGRPVSVRITGSTAAAAAGQEVQVQPCGPDAAGFTLGAGSHLLSTAIAHNATDPGASPGWNLDQLVLDSAPGGGPGAAPAPAGPLTATQPGPTPTVTVRANAKTTQQLSATGIRGPFELVLGQSVNRGWHAVATPAAGAPGGSHAVDLGPPELVDGYANGWSLSAAQLRTLGATGAGGTGALAVTLSWTPQRMIWLALGVSGAGIALCLVLAVLPERWRPRRRRRRAEAGAAALEGPEANGGALAVLGGDGVGVASHRPSPDASTDPTPGAPGVPVLGSPLTSGGRRPKLWVVAVLSVVAGGLAAAIASPLIGAAALVATAVTLVVNRARLVGVAIAVGLLVAAVVSVVHGQATHPASPDGSWPATSESAAVLVWMAVVFLGVDALVGAARARAAARRPADPPPD